MTNELSEIAQEMGESFNELKPRLMVVLRRESEKLAHQVKALMPVYSGRSKASWGKYTPEDLSASPPEGTNLAAWQKRKSQSNPDDAVWEENEDALSITQGSNVPEVEALNAGWSQQAPGGFIETVMDSGMEDIETALVDEIMKALEG